MHSSQQLFLFALAFLAGVALCALGAVTAVPTSALIGAGIIMVSVWSWRSARIIVLTVLCLGIGVFRYASVLPDLETQSARYAGGESIELAGIIADEPDRRVDHQKVILTPSSPEITGSVIVSLPLYPEVAYGQTLRVSCFLVTPEVIEDFDYPAYLALSGVYLQCQRGRIFSAEPAHPSLHSAVFNVKAGLIKRLNAMLPEPQASFLAGLLVGARQGIPQELKEAFNRTGVTHIIAISGYNITIIATITLAMTATWLGRKRAYWLILVLLVLFVILTGAQASVIRAALMGALVLTARQIGRQGSSWNILVLAAAVMVWVNPRVLLDDAGFQLSFLATIGLMGFSGPLEQRFGFLPEALGIRESGASTIAATLMTFPLILYQFGRFSVVAPFANVLILWLIPLSMALGFGAILTGVVVPPLVPIVAALAWLPLELIVCIVRTFASLPFASVTTSMPVAFLVAAEAGLLIGVVVIERRRAIVRTLQLLPE